MILPLRVLGIDGAKSISLGATTAPSRTRLGAVVAPKEIDFKPGLPKTRSGKIMRRLLKARELGLPEGDTSTLEESA